MLIDWKGVNTTTGSTNTGSTFVNTTTICITGRTTIPFVTVDHRTVKGASVTFDLSVSQFTVINQIRLFSTLLVVASWFVLIGQWSNTWSLSFLEDGWWRMERLFVVRLCVCVWGGVSEGCSLSLSSSLVLSLPLSRVGLNIFFTSSIWSSAALCWPTCQSERFHQCALLGSAAPRLLFSPSLLVSCSVVSFELRRGWSSVTWWPRRARKDPSNGSCATTSQPGPGGW